MSKKSYTRRKANPGHAEEFWKLDEMIEIESRKLWGACVRDDDSEIELLKEKIRQLKGKIGEISIPKGDFRSYKEESPFYQKEILPELPIEEKIELAIKHMEQCGDDTSLWPHQRFSIPIRRLLILAAKGVSK